MMLDYIMESLWDKKAEDITSLDLMEIEDSIADYLIIVTATSERHAVTLKESLIEQVKRKYKNRPYQVDEGLSSKEWILIDYSHIIVHIFSPEKRSYYNIESIWGDAKIKFFNKNVTINEW